MASSQAGRPEGRFVLLCLAPAVAFLLSSDSGLLLFLVFTSLTSVTVDVFRQRGKYLPFPIYLILVYALQISYYVVSSHIHIVDSANAMNQPQAVVHGGANIVALPLSAAAGSHDMKTMSIVMAAHNEHHYMKRTLESIYQRTPEYILKEIIVVDDGSKPPLAESCKDFPQVQVVRHDERKGLIKSKLEGGNMAVGDVIMFLDAHVKPYPNWVQPLFKHMNINYKRVVVPVIPILDGETWKENDNAVGTKMMFDWTLFFSWFEDYNDIVPCMSGGLFAITRQWWHESGEYDGQMRMWGAENIEQSIRVWLCGGEIFVARDSKIAHVFRSRFPYKINNSEIYINKVRTVEAWFDEYRDRFYEADPAARGYLPFVGDLSERKKLKQSLHCKPFKWYVEKFKDVFLERHMLPQEVFLIRDTVTNLCLRSLDDNQHLAQASCDEKDKRCLWTEANSGTGVRNAGANLCLDANAGAPEKEGQLVFMYQCFAKNQMQEWELKNGNLRWRGGAQHFCVKGGSSKGQMQLTKCSNSFMGKKGKYEKYKARQAPI